MEQMTVSSDSLKVLHIQLDNEEDFDVIKEMVEGADDPQAEFSTSAATDSKCESKSNSEMAGKELLTPADVAPEVWECLKIQPEGQMSQIFSDEKGFHVYFKMT